jgi:hypothetical protein
VEKNSITRRGCALLFLEDWFVTTYVPYLASGSDLPPLRCHQQNGCAGSQLQFRSKSRAKGKVVENRPQSGAEQRMTSKK